MPDARQPHAPDGNAAATCRTESRGPEPHHSWPPHSLPWEPRRTKRRHGASGTRPHAAGSGPSGPARPPPELMPPMHPSCCRSTRRTYRVVTTPSATEGSSPAPHIGRGPRASPPGHPHGPSAATSAEPPPQPASPSDPGAQAPESPPHGPEPPLRLPCADEPPSSPHPSLASARYPEIGDAPGTIWQRGAAATAARRPAAAAALGFVPGAAWGATRRVRALFDLSSVLYEDHLK
nr:predicted GPI-anchored protein 58 [Lolium perenne]